MAMAMAGGLAAASEPATRDPVLLALLPARVDKVLVVVTPPAPGARELERVVSEALAWSGRVGRVVPSSVLGSYQALGREELRERAFKLPIDVVVFTQGDEAGPALLTAAYRDGSTRGPASFTLARLAELVRPPAARKAEAAPPLKAELPEAKAPAAKSPATNAPAAKAPAATAPVAKAPAAKAPEPPAPEAPQLSEAEARAKYDELFVGFKDSPATVKRTEPYEGRYQRFLDWQEFYGKVGRRDLVESVENRRIARKLLLGAGVVLVVGGIVGFGAQAGVNACVGADCHPDSAGFIAGGILSAVGAAGIIGGSLIRTQLLPAWEARRLGDVYNAQLRDRLGVNP
jgi:hypothetical protein